MTSAAEIRSMETADFARPWEVRITCSSNPVLNQSTRNSTPATTSTTPSPSPDSTLQVLANTVNSLKQTNLGHLVSHTPAVSSDPMPSHTTCTKKSLSGPVNNRIAALEIQPCTPNKLLLLSALCESEAHVNRMEIHVFELQASHILNEAYARQLKQQLAAKEEKKSKKKAGKLVGDGLPRLLTGDQFYELAKEKEREIRDEERLKEDRRGAKERYREALGLWKVADERRKGEAAEARVKNKKATEDFNKKAAATKKGTKLKNSDKPTPIPIPKVIPRPKLKDFSDGFLQTGAPGDDKDDREVFEAVESGSEGSKDDKDDEDEE
ncbi:hypothetical protein CVT25_009837 [Psilocybe cyanescens]|uniref:Uncharacterized protein n=1 Tax=Psilocybe cyanescens TaxID=93625 RepID=A0A409XCS2_PSICY|nr:hypothetical protein CVT25_009837 [Psilocybe cyanescens]